MGDTGAVLCTGGRGEAAGWAASVRRAGEEPTDTGSEAVAALRALAAAVATLELGGLVTGSAAAECAAVLALRLERARLRAEGSADAIAGADQALREVEGEVACRVAGR